jgi:hypothetical protein
MKNEEQNGDGLQHQSSENKELIVNDLKQNGHHLETMENDELLSYNNKLTPHSLPYNRSMSTDHSSYQQRLSSIQKTKSVPGDPYNNQENCNNSQNKELVFKDLQENKSMPADSNNKNFNDNFSKFNKPEERKSECNNYSPVQY